MFDRLEAVEQRYDKLTELLCDPAVMNDPAKLREYSKEQSNIEETVQAYREYKSVTSQLKDAKSMLDEKLDDEMREMVKMEIDELSTQRQELEDHQVGS